MTAQKAHVCKRAIPVGERYRRLRGRDARINVKAHERRATRSAARGRRHEGDRRSANWSCRFRSLAVLRRCRAARPGNSIRPFTDGNGTCRRHGRLPGGRGHRWQGRRGRATDRERRHPGIDDQSVEAGGSNTFDLAPHFTDPNGDDAKLKYKPAALDAATATAEVSGMNLTVNGIKAGMTTITVTATDGEGWDTKSTFKVTVTTPDPPEPTDLRPSQVRM